MSIIYIYINCAVKRQVSYFNYKDGKLQAESDQSWQLSCCRVKTVQIVILNIVCSFRWSKRWSGCGSDPTWVISGEELRPLLSAAGQAVGQADPLPGQQAVWAEPREQRGVEDADGGLRHQQAAAQQVEIIQRHEEPCRSRRS